MSLRVGYGALLAMALSGCGAAAPLVPPARGGPSWTEISSAHIVLRTDLDASDAREASVGFEGAYTVLEDVAFPYQQKPKDRILVVLLRDEAAFRVFEPREHFGGFFTTGVDGYEEFPIAVFFGRFAALERGLGTFMHELTHRFVHFYYPRAPPWLNEGLAQYFSTLSADEGVAMLGRQLQPFGQKPIFRLRGHDDDTDAQKVAAVPRINDLLAMSHAQFYGAASRDEAGAESEVSGNYLASWVLVHLLRNGPEDYRRRFRRMLAAIAKSGNPEAAFGDAFGDLAPRLQREVEILLGRDDMVWQQETYEPTKLEPGRERTMTDVEVHLLWASVASLKGLSGRARADLDEAIRLAPDSVEARLASIRWYRRHGDPARAKGDLAAALTTHPNDMRVQFARFTHLVSKQGRPSPGELDALAAQLAPRVTTAYAMNELAWYLANHEQAKLGLPLAQRSVALDPSCWECFDTLALLLHHSGALDDAVAAQTMAVNLVPEGRREPQLAERLRKLTEAARAAKAPAPHPP